MRTVYELTCFSSLLEFDVVLPVIMQRQVLAVLCRITVEVPQTQCFDAGVVPQIQFIVRCEQRQVSR